jgi:uncharacterized protein (TIGR04255 family)
MEHIRPCRDNNAIKIAAIAFEFSQPITENSIRKFLSFYQQDNELKTEFPNSQNIDSVVFQMGPNLSSQQVKGIGGVVLDAPLNNGEPPISLTLRTDALIFTCSDYNSWTDFFSSTIKYFKKVIPTLDGVRSNVVGVEYYDEFLINPAAKLYDWKKNFFRLNNAYISNTILNADDLWHIHQGFFDNHSLSPQRLLNIIELNLVDMQANMTLLVKTQHKLNLVEDVNIDDLICNQSEKYLNAIHDKNKEIISNILSDEALASINMDKE